MTSLYSRRNSVERKKNIRSAYVFGALTIVSLVLLFFFGLPAIVKFSAFLGEVRKSGEPVSIEDTTPPAPPRLDEIPEFTNKLNIDISGSAEPGSTVIIKFNSDEVEILVNKEGIFSKSYGLQKGNNVFSLVARDSSGNISQESDSFRVVFDDTPPELTIAKPENESQYFGSRQRQIVIEGTTESDANVTINDRFVSVSENGGFTFATTLNEGENVFAIKSIDPAGNSTEESLNLTFSL